jgi:hypothetical protein
MGGGHVRRRGFQGNVPPEVLVRFRIRKAGTGSGACAASRWDCGTSCAIDQTFGASETLQAVPDSGSRFDGWRAVRGVVAVAAPAAPVARSLAGRAGGHEWRVCPCTLTKSPLVPHASGNAPEDPGHQGRPRRHGPGPEGGQGARGRGPKPVKEASSARRPTGSGPGSTRPARASTSSSSRRRPLCFDGRPDRAALARSGHVQRAAGDPRVGSSAYGRRGPRTSQMRRAARAAWPLRSIL